MSICIHPVKVLIITLILCIAGFSCDSGNSKQQKALDIKLQPLLDHELNENIPGIVANITAPDRNILWCGSAGLSDKEKNVKLHPDQTFRIASITKTFVAATILRLWEDKKLSLDDPITRYISEQHSDILKRGGYDPAKITVRNLLRHSGGLAEHTTSDKYKVGFMKSHHIWTRTEQIEDLIKYAKPVGPVGEQFSYSDTGYILLGEIIENITGKSMGDAMMEQLNLRKLGLDDTHMEDYNPENEVKRIHQYYQNTDTYDFHPSLDYFGGGGLLSTTIDLSRFFLSLFQHKVYRFDSTLDTMLAPVRYKTETAMDYRMGIWRIQINGMTAYTHSGFWGTQVVYIPEINTAVAVNYSQRWAKKGIAPVIPELVNVIKPVNKKAP